MRLGDLDALKSDLKQYFSDGTLESVSAKLAFNMILRKIDNAPTVELTEEQAIDKLHETGWLIRHDKEMTERPQGDSISRSELKEFIKKYYKQTSQIKSLLSFIDTRKGGTE